LIWLADELYTFIWSQHHLLMDGWSAGLALRELSHLYEAYNQGQPVQLKPNRPFRDYIEWFQQQNLDRAQTFWREELKGFSTPTPLSVDTLSQQGKKHEEQHGEWRLNLSAATTAKLRSFAREHQLTMNTLVQGAWALLLSRYSGDDDVVFGSVVS